MTVSGLEADTQYTIKIYALSPVGRSDVVTMNATTAASGSKDPDIEQPEDPQTKPDPKPGQNTDPGDKPAPDGNENPIVKPTASSNVNNTGKTVITKNGRQRGAGSLDTCAGNIRYGYGCYVGNRKAKKSKINISVSCNEWGLSH